MRSIDHLPGFISSTTLPPQPQQQLCADVENFSEMYSTPLSSVSGIRSVNFGLMLLARMDVALVQDATSDGIRYEPFVAHVGVVACVFQPIVDAVSR